MKTICLCTSSGLRLHYKCQDSQFGKRQKKITIVDVLFFFMDAAPCLLSNPILEFFCDKYDLYSNAFK